ncbi:hypothetical protein QQF64_015365 [Cirrhinus molitorella]|uniref:Uncharacterized protein n=1 Tax=Cirrhinus molitorella TaxID=172907 RepID=A0ABR3NW67_9TELE
MAGFLSVIPFVILLRRSDNRQLTVGKEAVAWDVFCNLMPSSVCTSCPALSLERRNQGPQPNDSIQPCRHNSVLKDSPDRRPQPVPQINQTSMYRLSEGVRYLHGHISCFNVCQSFEKIF